MKFLNLQTMYLPKPQLNNTRYRKGNEIPCWISKDPSSLCSFSSAIESANPQAFNYCSIDPGIQEHHRLSRTHTQKICLIEISKNEKKNTTRNISLDLFWWNSKPLGSGLITYCVYVCICLTKWIVYLPTTRLLSWIQINWERFEHKMMNRLLFFYHQLPDWSHFIQDKLKFHFLYFFPPNKVSLSHKGVWEKRGEEK